MVGEKHLFGYVTATIYISGPNTVSAAVSSAGHVYILASNQLLYHLAFIKLNSTTNWKAILVKGLSNKSVSLMRLNTIRLF